MSDLNDDLLNYELGEDIDEQALLEDDEDELLLSDEEINTVTHEQKEILKDEAEKWVNCQLKTVKKPTDNGANLNKETKLVCENFDNPIKKNDTQNNIDNSVDCVTKSENVSNNTEGEQTDIQKYTKYEGSADADEDLDGINESVTSDLERKENDGKEAEYDVMAVLSENKADNVAISCCEVEKLSIQSQSSKDDANDEYVIDPREDVEERSTRSNIKQTSERGEVSDAMSRDKFPPGRFIPAKRGRFGPCGRGQFAGPRSQIWYPHTGYNQYSHPTENTNPQGPPPSGGYYPYSQSDLSVGSLQPHHFTNNEGHVRPDFRLLILPNFRGRNAVDFNLMARGVRPDISNHSNALPLSNFGQSNSMRPMFPQRFESQVRPRMTVPRAPAELVQGNANFLNQTSGLPPRAVVPPGCQLPQSSGSLPAPAFCNQPTIAQPVVHTKILINPNFKGGVQAATNQLMKNTQFMQAIRNHASHLQSDEELLRQQEEFINKNLRHIERRRHERTPERNRSRERSYSPLRRERRDDSRERRADSRGRQRRYGDNRDYTGKNDLRRRRSGSFERRKERDKPYQLEEEDEETRAYRLEIEKQKVMREKILRDKELRRRRAVEGKLREEDKPTNDEPPQKLKPIIVTESKIISLKKKRADKEPKTSLSKINALQHQAIQRTIPTAKILPEAKRKTTKLAPQDSGDSTSASIATAASGSGSTAATTTSSQFSTTLAVIKPVLQKTVAADDDLENYTLKYEEFLDEDLLLDSPSPPSSSPCSPLTLASGAQITTSITTITTPTTTSSTSDTNSKSIEKLNCPFNSSSRRIVLKLSSKDSGTTNSVKKGVFDRLDKKTISDNSFKKKIHRFIIKNAE